MPLRDEKELLRAHDLLVGKHVERVAAEEGYDFCDHSN